MKTLLIVLLPLLAVSTALGAASPYTVNGTSDLWLAGASSDTVASGEDTLSNAAPFLIPVAITGGTSYTFKVTGSVSNTPYASGLSPDGGSFTWHDAGAQNGISNIHAPMNSLIGVFLDSTVSLSGEQGTTLNFDTTGQDHLGTNFTTLAPTLNQAFFIGDGLATITKGRTTTTLTQTFVAPTGATRLFLGTMDGYEWSNNSGLFSVTLTPVPEPATYAALLGIGTLGFVAVRRYRLRKD
jgi:hypothetical protein